MPARGTTVGVLGVGAVGQRVAQQLLSTNVADSVVVHDPNEERAAKVAQTLGDRATASSSPRLERADLAALVVCTPCGDHIEPARRAVRRQIPAISVSDRVADVRGLLGLNRRAVDRGVNVVIGAGFSPGLSCLLAVHGAKAFDLVDEVHIAKDGTGGPACARQHHRALKLASLDWRDGEFVRRPGGSGRELVWFPEPIDGADCYRAALPEALLVQPAFRGARRITARLSATRQDRFTTWLPMLSPPHADGGVGAVRVELRGVVDGARVTTVAGSACAPAQAAAAVAAAATYAVLQGRVGPPGARGLATSVDASLFLRDVQDRGVDLVEFEGLGF